MTDAKIFDCLNRIAQAIYDKKGMNTVVLDVRGVSSMTDFFVIAEGTVDRHVKALSEVIVDEMALRGLRPWHIEGQQEGDWVVVDFNDFVIHLFIPELREKYALEQLWKQGKIVDVQIVVHKTNDRQPIEGL
jgi:ribosome-associated protein